MATAKNVLGGPLQPCSTKPLTGFYRNGCCDTGYEDTGLHLICVVTTKQFLAFSASRGNDLSTPFPAYGFPGLRPGDRWCLCAARWVEALEAGVAPKVVLESTHISMLEFADLETMQQYAADADIPF
jgi:uncharacterized protein